MCGAGHVGQGATIYRSEAMRYWGKPPVQLIWLDKDCGWENQPKVGMFGSPAGYVRFWHGRIGRLQLRVYLRG